MRVPSFTYFLAVAEQGSIRGAAETMNVNPSSITRQVQQLEHEFRCTLFERRIDGMVLTEEGRALERHFRNSVRELELARDQIDQIRNLLTGNVSFSTIEGTVSSWLLPAISAFREDHEGVTFSGSVEASDAVYRSVVQEQVDFGIAILDRNFHEINIVKKFDTRFKLAMSLDHPLAGKKHVRLKDVPDQTLVMLNKDFYTRQIFDECADRSGLSFTISLELNHIELLKHEVRQNRGITVLPDYAVQDEENNGSLRIFDITKELPSQHPTILFTKKQRRLSRAVEKFLETLVSIDTNKG